MKTKNILCLGKDRIYPADEKESGINENIMVVGPTRCGKTMSVVEPRLLHTFDRSLIVAVTKRTLVEQYSEVFKARGYEVMDLDFTDPGHSPCGYDPLAYIQNDADVFNLSVSIMETCYSSRGDTKDPFWYHSSIDLLSCIIELALLNARSERRTATFADVYAIYNALEIRIKSPGGEPFTSLDEYMEEAIRQYPESPIGSLWTTFRANPEKTIHCVYTTLKSALATLFVPEALALTQSGAKVDFKKLAQKKSILFVTTSPVNKAFELMTTMVYRDAFKTFFEYAESLPAKRLPVPVHVICDDFATGAVIPDFAEQISVFCAKGISVTLLLQSESQLISRYGQENAVTILNNCDTYIYMGGMDDMTCDNIARRCNKPRNVIFSLAREHIIIFRRGDAPVFAERYNTTEDPLYRELIAPGNRR